MELLKYRYGGFCWRVTEEWNAENSRVTTSEGKSRDEADGTTARWVMAQGKLNKSTGGMVILSHPNNYNHPEPLRVWPGDMREDGGMMINFSPTKTTNWLLKPGNSYQLNYRLIVFSTNLSNDEAEDEWNKYLSYAAL